MTSGGFSCLDVRYSQKKIFVEAVHGKLRPLVLRHVAQHTLALDL